MPNAVSSPGVARLRATWCFGVKKAFLFWAGRWTGRRKKQLTNTGLEEEDFKDVEDGRSLRWNPEEMVVLFYLLYIVPERS